MKPTTQLLGSLVLVCAILLPLQLHARSAQSQELACVSGNCNKDIRDLHKLARHGSAEAMTLLSMIYATGDGRPAEPERALRMLSRAAKSGHEPALLLLSDWYERGFVVEQDPAQAASLLQKAVALDYAPALYKVAVTKLLDPAPGIQRDGLALLEKASEKKLLDAVFLLARMKLSGEIAEQDINAAATLFKQLVLVGHQPSRPYLQNCIALLSAQISAQVSAQAEVAEQVADLQQSYDMEIIQVIGRDLKTESMLTNVVQQLQRTGLFDPGSMVRIRSQRCDGSFGCVSISPRAGDRDLKQSLTNSM